MSPQRENSHDSKVCYLDETHFVFSKNWIDKPKNWTDTDNLGQKWSLYCDIKTR